MRKVIRVNPDVARAHILHKLQMRALALYIIGCQGRRPERAAQALAHEAKQQAIKAVD